MRTPIVALALLFAFLAVPATDAGRALVSGTPVVAVAQESQQPAPPESQPSQPSQPSNQPAPPQAPAQSTSSPQLNVTVDQQPDRVWYANPTWIAIGVIAAGLLVVIIVMAARGGSGGPTVVRGA